MEELIRNVHTAIPYPAREVRIAFGLVLVLIDPDHYLTDPAYKKQRESASFAHFHLQPPRLLYTLYP